MIFVAGAIVVGYPGDDGPIPMAAATANGNCSQFVCVQVAGSAKATMPDLCEDPPQLPNLCWMGTAEVSGHPVGPFDGGANVSIHGDSDGCEWWIVNLQANGKSTSGTPGPGCSASALGFHAGPVKEECMQGNGDAWVLDVAGQPLDSVEAIAPIHCLI